MTEEITATLDDLCLSLSDDMCIMQALARTCQPPAFDASSISAGLMAQERLKRLCKLLGHEPTRKLSGTAP